MDSFQHFFSKDKFVDDGKCIWEHFQVELMHGSLKESPKTVQIMNRFREKTGV